MLQVASVQLVGSVPFNSAKEVFIKSLQDLPGGLHTNFNGERGSRDDSVMWQSFSFFSPSPTIGMEGLKKELISNADWIISNVPSMMNGLWNFTFKTCSALTTLFLPTVNISSNETIAVSSSRLQRATEIRFSKS